MCTYMCVKVVFVFLFFLFLFFFAFFLIQNFLFTF